MTAATPATPRWTTGRTEDSHYVFDDLTGSRVAKFVNPADATRAVTSANDNVALRRALAGHLFDGESLSTREAVRSELITQTTAELDELRATMAKLRGDVHHLLNPIIGAIDYRLAYPDEPPLDLAHIITRLREVTGKVDAALGESAPLSTQLDQFSDEIRADAAAHAAGKDVEL